MQYRGKYSIFQNLISSVSGYIRERIMNGYVMTGRSRYTTNDFAQIKSDPLPWWTRKYRILLLSKCVAGQEWIRDVIEILNVRLISFFRSTGFKETSEIKIGGKHKKPTSKYHKICDRLDIKRKYRIPFALYKIPKSFTITNLFPRRGMLEKYFSSRRTQQYF